MDIDHKQVSLHLKYWIFILVLAIIAIATDRWTAQKDFTTYLSNAATLTSLMLGLVAIFYSFISNDSLSKSLGGISAVSGEVRETRDQIVRFVDLTRQVADSGEKNASSLYRASEEVTNSLGSLTTTLQEIAKQNEVLQGYLAGLPNRFDQLESKVTDFAAAVGEKRPEPTSGESEGDVSAKTVERFLKRSSLAYNLFTYSCVLASQKQTPVSIEAVNKALSMNIAQGMVGFLVCMDSMGLLVRKLVKGQSRVYRITNVHPDLERTIKDYYINYVNTEYVDDAAERAKWMANLANVEALFSA